jgi:hypothetical protein
MIQTSYPLPGFSKGKKAKYRKTKGDGVCKREGEDYE